MFERPHHQRIAKVLSALDGALLRRHGCLFGGGTCISLRFNEYRESVDIDFLISDAGGYRALRQKLTAGAGFNSLLRDGALPLRMLRDIRADQYGIRTQLMVDDQAIKFEIVREARIVFQSPGVDDRVCGVPSLSVLDLATSKMLANADRHADDGVFSRDLIDLAMMNLRLPTLRAALLKAEGAYGISVAHDLARAIDNVQQRQGWLERCMRAMAMSLPRALVWQRVRSLRRVLKPLPTK